LKKKRSVSRRSVFLFPFIPPGRAQVLDSLHLRRDTAITEFSYSGTELDAVAEATNYYRWIIDSFAPALGVRIVEAGAGIGTVSELLLTTASPKELLLVEPAQNNIGELRRRFDRNARVSVVHGYLEEVAGSFEADTVVAVNVLEHVERPDDFLRAAHQILSPGGALLILVPALPGIYGSLDVAFDHYRRYTRAGLRDSLRSAGFAIEKLHYLNFVGVAAWFMAGRVLSRTTLGRTQVRFYDRWVIPWLSRIESRLHPPFGQSLLAIARKV
jgi:SAM-dependent methyltransferase